VLKILDNNIRGVLKIKTLIKNADFCFETRFIIYAYYRVNAASGKMSKGFLSPITVH
jgi:hypothetical protein